MSKKLLLADDSITIQKVIGITFADEDYDLTVVGDGDSALEKARAERPDLVLADVFMPGRNGYELCASIKQDPELEGVPVLLLTGTFEPFDEAKAAAAGADSWIAKPFESQALIDRVQELLARSAQAPPGLAGSVATAAAVEDIWSDLPGLEMHPEEAAEPAGIEEAFAAAAESATPDEGAPPSPEDDIWQSLGEELPAEEEAADPFAFAQAEEELAAERLADPFAEQETSEEAADAWTMAAEPEGEGPEGEAAWDAFDDEEILALDESDILEEDLEILEDDAFVSVIAPDAEEAADGWAGELLPAGADEGVDRDSGAEEDLASAGEPLMSEAAIDFLAAEAEEEEEFPSAGILSEAEIGEELPVVESFSDADYAFSLEEPPAEAPSPVAGPSVAPAPPEPAWAAPPVAAAAESAPTPAGVEAQVASLSEAEIERIVEKVAGSVIERLARTMLERIAWEVVPDLAESMIKEEIRKIREEAR